jgi:hypothetical protein
VVSNNNLPAIWEQQAHPHPTLSRQGRGVKKKKKKKKNNNNKKIFMVS